MGPQGLEIRRKSTVAGRYTTAQVLLVGALALALAPACGEPAAPVYGPLVIATTSLPNAEPTVPYRETLAAMGGDSVYEWSVPAGALPPGLSLSPSSGLIAGTPSTEGSYAFTARVTSGDGQVGTKQLSIAVAPPVLQPAELCSDYPDYAIATFADTALAAAVRSALSVDEPEDLTCGRLAGLTILSANYDGITSLVGMQNLTGLLGLDLEGNSLSNLSPLRGLTSLTWLQLSHASLRDIGPLSGLSGLSSLDLHENAISDLSPLRTLTSLQFLLLSGNAINDLSPLSGLTNLTDLRLGGNSITDVSPLSGLTGLSLLDLAHNADLVDIRPLLDNTGLGAGDYVILDGTGVSCADVAALRARGVTVESDCP